MISDTPSTPELETDISLKHIIHMGREEAIVRDKKCKGRVNYINLKISLSEKKKKIEPEKLISRENGTLGR